MGKIERARRIKKIKSTDFPIEVFYDGLLLKGRIIDYDPKDDRGGIEILLEEPQKYKGKDQIVACFGLAMAGHDFFEENGELTEWAIGRSKKELVEIYKRKKKEILKQKNAPSAYEAAKRLNKKDKK